MALQAEELPGQGPLPADHLAHGDRGVVVGGPGGHGPEEAERGHVGGLEGLGALPGVGRDVEGVGVRQAHHREGRLAADPGDLDRGLAEVELGLAGRVGERDEHLLVMAVVPGHRLLDLGDAARVAVLVPEATEDPRGRVVLLGGRLPVGGQDLLDDRKVGAELGPGARSPPPVPRWLGVGQDLLQGLVGDAVVPGDRSFRGALHEHPAPDLGPLLHVGSHSFSHPLGSAAPLEGELGGTTEQNSGCRGVDLFDRRFQAGSVRLFNRRLQRSSDNVGGRTSAPHGRFRLIPGTNERQLVHPVELLPPAYDVFQANW